MLLDIFSLSFHSVWTSFFRDSRSASVFFVPGLCVAESQFSVSCANFQICLDKVPHFPEWLVPNLFMQATAVELSHSIFIWGNRMWRARDCKPNSIALSWKTLMWFCIFSSEKSLNLLSSLNPLLFSNHLRRRQFLFLLRGWKQWCHYRFRQYFFSIIWGRLLLPLINRLLRWNCFCDISVLLF